MRYCGGVTHAWRIGSGPLLLRQKVAAHALAQTGWRHSYQAMPARTHLQVKRSCSVAVSVLPVLASEHVPWRWCGCLERCVAWCRHIHRNENAHCYKCKATTNTSWTTRQDYTCTSMPCTLFDHSAMAITQACPAQTTAMPSAQYKKLA